MAKWETEAEENHRLRQMRINEMKSKSAEEAGESALSAGTDRRCRRTAQRDGGHIWRNGSGHIRRGRRSECKPCGEPGRVENEVSVAKEDLDLMRDVAEMRFLQNFVSLTPR